MVRSTPKKKNKPRPTEGKKVSRKRKVSPMMGLQSKFIFGENPNRLQFNLNNFLRELHNNNVFKIDFMYCPESAVGGKPYYTAIVIYKEK